MKTLQFALFYIGLTLSACAESQYADINITYSNLSNSYIYPYKVRINKKYSAHTEPIGCSEGKGSGSLVMAQISPPPSLILVEWEHLLSRKTYRARIPLQAEAGKWWQTSPFRDTSGRRLSRPPVLVIQWRGARQVVAMLVASSFDFSLGKMDIGSAEGEEISRPANGPKLYLSYADLQRKPGDRFMPGTVRNYDRTLDDTLTTEQRFGCPRTPDGRLDRKRLPPQKLPYMIGANGEHIPCRAEFCADREDEIRALRSLGWRRYPADETPPAIEFRDAPNPKPAR